MKAILFDMDGVLIDSEKLKFWTWINTLKSFEVKICPEEIDNIKRNILGRKRIEIAEFLSKTYGIEKEKILERRNEFLQEVIPKYPLMPGAKEFLRKFKGILRYAVVTSTGRKTMEYLLRKFELEKYFEVKICGEDVSRGKPDPEPYLLAMKRLNLYPKDCMVIEDSRNGILSAKRAGVGLIIGFLHKINSIEDLKDSDTIVQSFSELEKIIEEIIKRE